jgi:hypothetical protein
MKAKLRLMATLLFASIYFAAFSASAQTQPNDDPACTPTDAITGVCDNSKPMKGCSTSSFAPVRAHGLGVLGLGLGFAFLLRRKRAATVS